MNNTERNDADILFTSQFKSGKRVYYIDVKEDRRGEFYVSVTESKRAKNLSEDGNMGFSFEKHKIFVYRHDLQRFVDALSEAINYTRQEAALRGLPDERRAETYPADPATDSATDFNFDF